jgi:predicted AAA+ superfamily ATPase
LKQLLLAGTNFSCWFPRELETQVRRAAANFPALVLTGPRRGGKTFLLQHSFPDADYRLLEDPDLISRFRHDPQGFLDSIRTPAILDEVQNVPEVFAYVRSRIDRQPRKKGQWFLTGSQEAPLMQGVTESMAGRAATLQLLPLSSRNRRAPAFCRGVTRKRWPRRGRPGSGLPLICKPQLVEAIQVQTGRQAKIVRPHDNTTAWWVVLFERIGQDLFSKRH